MAASIRVTLRETVSGPVVGPVTTSQSRDDLRKGYEVVLESVDAASTYSWQLSYTPESTGGGSDPLEGSDSSAVFLAPEGSTSSTARFVVDHEGAYLIRLVVDAGLGTEDVEFVRLRYLTQFGDLKLVSAGERRDQTGVIPVDADPEGWSNDQNRNLQRLALLIRRLSTSGRALFVDSNRGRDSTSTPDDPDNLVSIPGWDPSNIEGTGMVTGAEAFADFSTITEAIAYALDAASRSEPAPSASEPYFVFVQPGLYVEDVQFRSNVHVIGLGVQPDIEEIQRFNAGSDLDVIAEKSVLIRTANSGGFTCEYTPSADPTTDRLILQNLYIENTANAISEPVLKHGGGMLFLRRCVIYQRGDDATQGPAYGSVTSDTALRPALAAEDTVFWSLADANDDRYAVELDAPKANWLFSRCTIFGLGSALKHNESLYGGGGDPEDSILELEDCKVSARGITGYALRSYGTFQHVVDTTLSPFDATKAFSIDPFGAGAGSKTGDVNVRLENSRVLGDVIFDVDGAAGTTSFVYGTTSLDGSLSFPNGAPTTLSEGAHAKTLHYDEDYTDPVTGSPVVPATSQLGVDSVQDAIDRLILSLFPLGSSPFLSLETAYNGLSTIDPPVAGAGLGARIPADDGPVEITESPAPAGPSISALDQTNYDGWLKVEGGVDVGGLVTDGLGSEISLDPNFMGTGPFLRLGRQVYSDDAGSTHRAINAATVLTGSAFNTNRYNLRMRTRDSPESSTDRLGRAILEGGMSIEPSGGGASPTAGSVFLEAGDYRNAAVGGLPGNVYAKPGTSDAGDPDGRFLLVCPSTATATTLQAANPFVGGVAGTAFFATPNGYVALTVGAGDSDATVAAAISDLEGLQGSVAGGGELVITTDLQGPNADVHYIGDDQGGALNTALGEFRVNSGATLTPGTYPDTVGLYCAGSGVLGVDGSILGVGTPSFTRLLVNSDYTLAAGISIVGVDSRSGPVQITLPNSAAAGATDGRLIFINDEAGAAGIGNEINIVVGSGFPHGLIDNTLATVVVFPPTTPGPVVIGSPDNGITLYCAGETITSDTFGINAAGSGYVVGEQVEVLGGTGLPMIVEVTATGGGGSVSSLDRLEPGNYSVAPASPVSTNSLTGSGTGLTLNVTFATVGSYYLTS